ncbi:TetR/AcrR family transcriptional regulator [Xenophilus sp.]|uniref:TetR/AcrR family transcriptional regulator n=1 Tax=Xenophilus sp. TaxID=1873499 RepID=UPI0037DD0C9F
MKAPPADASLPPPRATYRHGDLRRALLEAGVELARHGGPDAVVLREATRRAGVVPNAAYRHFASRGALLEAVRAEAVARMARAMEAELAVDAPAKGGGKGDAVDAARAAVRAVGAGYLRFAREETGLFRTAFADLAPVEGDADPAKAGGSGLNPFQLLGAALDQLVQAGVMPPERRPGAEYLAWSTVHGLAMLTIAGPLRGLAGAEIEALGQRLLEMVERGL